MAGIQFPKKNIFDFTCHLVRKCPKQIIYFAQRQKHIWIRIRIFKPRSADPDPKKNGPDPPP